jgi:DNA-binding NarL/FixJ family response regulator
MANIILVEDEKDSRRMLEIGLVRFGHTVAACANGKEAIAALNPATDMVITDLVMPTMDGLSLLKTLAEKEHNAKRIVITSFADKDRTIQVLNLGVHYLMEKPFSVDQLQNTIQIVMNKASEVGTVDQLFQRQIASLNINERERTIIFYLLKGLHNADIARLSNTSEGAIKSVLFALYKKLGVSSRGELFHLIFPL